MNSLSLLLAYNPNLDLAQYLVLTGVGNKELKNWKKKCPISILNFTGKDTEAQFKRRVELIVGDRNLLFLPSLNAYHD